MTKKKEHPLVHLRLESDEAMQMKKDILQLEMGIVRILQIINNYRNLRKKNYETKNKMYDTIKQTHSDLNKLKRVNFPKINKSGIVKKIEDKYDDNEDKKNKKSKKKSKPEKSKKTEKEGLPQTELEKQKQRLREKYLNQKEEQKPLTTKEKLKSTIAPPEKQSNSKDSSKKSAKKVSKEQELQNELRTIQEQLKKLEAN